MYKTKPKVFDINCLDPLGRNGLSIAIINENPEMMDLLLSEGIQVKDALLLAISEEYVEGVELLLSDEEKNHEPGNNSIFVRCMLTLLNIYCFEYLDVDCLYVFTFLILRSSLLLGVGRSN